MLACVTCLALSTNLSNLKALIAPMENVNSHFSDWQCTWRNMRCWQILDLNVALFDVETGKFSNTDKVSNEFICIYHISPNGEITRRATEMASTTEGVPGRLD